MDECKSFTRSFGGNALNYNTGNGVCVAKVCPASEDIMIGSYVNDDYNIHAEIGCHRLLGMYEFYTLKKYFDTRYLYYLL